MTHLIPSTDVLRNLISASTTAELAAAEADLSFARALQLFDTPVPATHDLRELQAIHHRLFQDVYDWAGEIRGIDVRKDVPGAEFFMPFGLVEHAAANCFGDLAADDLLVGLLVGLPRDAFVERLAFHHERINHAAARAGSDLQDLGPLIAMSDKVVTQPEASQFEVWSTQEIQRLSISPSDDRG